VAATDVESPLQRGQSGVGLAAVDGHEPVRDQREDLATRAGEASFVGGDRLGMLGRPFEMREIEINMPAFAGHIRTSSDAFRFVLGHKD
jgi:hypothetical protein